MDTNLTNSKKTKNKLIFSIVFFSSLVVVLLFYVIFVQKNLYEQVNRDINTTINDVLDNVNDLQNIQDSDENIKTEEIEQVEEEYLKVINQCINLEFYYETENPSKPITNVKGVSKEEFLESTKKYYDNYALISGKNQSENEMKSEYGINLLLGKDTGYDRYIRIKNRLFEGDALYEQLNSLSNISQITEIYIEFIVAISIVLIVLVIMLKKGKYTEWKRNYILDLYSKIYIEFKVLLWLIVIPTLLAFIDYTWYSNNIFETIICIILIILVISFLLYSIIYEYNLIVKADENIRKNYIRSIIFKFFNFLSKKYKEITKLIIGTMSVQSTMVKTTFIVTILVIYNIYMAFSINIILNHRHLFLIKWILICGAIVGLYGIFKVILNVAVNVNKIKDITDSIVQGNYNSNIKVETEGTIKMIADNLENIENGLNEAVSKAITSEKMKSELITNVSHDLKTPLTSIINYVDLLSKDGISEEERVKYLSVLNKKSQRLKVLIENLFEVSKATSGTIELNMQSIDPVALLRQTIGEFEDKIEISDLKFIKKLPEEKAMIYVDGKRTFRVFQNLISNILKYSLKGSRVYIEIKEIQDYIEISFKNISEYELNFTATEIVERFKRGDLSRTTEGSGLGLAIAKSLVEIQGGQFEIIIDGDLFKVLVRFKKENINS